MPKRRRKLSSEYEKRILLCSKEVELILAKIHDIYDDDIREEYIQAFSIVKAIIDSLLSDYKTFGYTDNSENNFKKYQVSLESFKSEFEI